MAEKPVHDRTFYCGSCNGPVRAGDSNCGGCGARTWGNLLTEPRRPSR